MWHAARMSHAAKAPDTSAWPTHTEAATQLGTDERTIRRWIESGRLKSSRRSRPGSKPVVIIDPETIARVRAERRTPIVLNGQESETTASDSGSMPLARIAPDARDPFAGLAAHLAGLATFAAHYPAPSKPWLTLDEAVEYSGLTRGWLLNEAEAGQGSIEIRDMGKHTRGGRWRFLRDDLGKGTAQ